MRRRAPPTPRRDGAVLSPVGGIVTAVEVRAGDAVRRGQPLATVEAMKMQYAILAPLDGVVSEARAVAGAADAGEGAAVRHYAAGDVS